MSDLKPCPFCGGEAKLDIFADMYVVHCKNYGCQCQTTAHCRKEDAVEAWNRRTGGKEKE